MGPASKEVKIKTSIESTFFEFSFLNLKNSPSVKGKRRKTIMRSYLKANPNALNAKKNSEDGLIVLKYTFCIRPISSNSPNEKTNTITINDAAYDARV